MSLATITRLRPADLQEIQVQTTTNQTIASVIQGLQYVKSNAGPSLNTSCPTCVVSDSPTGFVNATYSGKTFKIPCPTCKGYLLYHTADGGLTPPTNPFGSPLAVTRILPADLVQAKLGFPSSTALNTMIVSLQTNHDTPPTNNCPQCTHTGWITISSVKTICPLCNGVQKTVLNYSFTSGQAAIIVPTIPPPDPLPTPPPAE